MKQFCLAGLLAIAASAVLLPSAVLAHDRKEVAGLVVIFGAEPEPALTGERQWLRWRFRSGEEPFSELLDATAVPRHNFDDIVGIPVSVWALKDLLNSSYSDFRLALVPNWHRPYGSLGYKPPISRVGFNVNNLFRFHN